MGEKLVENWGREKRKQRVSKEREKNEKERDRQIEGCWRRKEILSFMNSPTNFSLKINQKTYPITACYYYGRNSSEIDRKTPLSP